MDKLGILAASATEPSMSLRRKSDLVNTYVPELGYLLHCSNLIGSALLSLSLHMTFMTYTLCTYLLHASRIVTVYTALAFRVFLRKSAESLRRNTSSVWKAKGFKRLRKRIEYELFTILVGPGGNTLCLVLFWPGWIVVGGSMFLVWTVR